MIIEKYINLKKDSSLNKLIQEFRNTSSEEFNDFEYAQIIYLDTKPKKLIQCQLYFSNKHFEKGNVHLHGFNSIVHKMKDKGYFDCLFAATLYPTVVHCPMTISDAMCKSNYPESLLIDDVLRSSYGMLVYHYQLEELYMMVTGCNKDEAIEFRKKIYKLPNREERLSKIMLYKHLTFLDIYCERSYLNLTIHPNYKGAKVLYDYLNK